MFHFKRLFLFSLLQNNENTCFQPVVLYLYAYFYFRFPEFSHMKACWNAGSESNLLSVSPLWPWWSPNVIRTIVYHMISLPLASPIRLPESSDSLLHEAPVEKTNLCCSAGTPTTQNKRVTLTMLPNPIKQCRRELIQIIYSCYS